MALRNLFLVTVLLLTVQNLALAQTSVDYKFSGVFTWGKIISMLCDGGWCRTALPREFYALEVPISIYETSFDDAFRALKMQALADGYVLTKTGSERPYNVSVRQKTDEESAYISCLDSAVHLVPAKYLKSYIRADSLKCLGMVRGSRDSLWWEDSVRVVPLDRFRINFYVVSSMYLDEYGVDWTNLWATGNLWKTPHLISDWALRAVASGDTLSEFRTIEIDIDSAASLHWGSQLKEEKSTYQTGEIAKKIDELFDLRPKAIEERLKLRNPIYEETASYGHMGREPKVVTKTYESMYRETKTVEVELFTWEKLDYVGKIKEAFGL